VVARRGEEKAIASIQSFVIGLAKPPWLDVTGTKEPTIGYAGKTATLLDLF
jgi:hypothetical protein